MGTLYAQPHHYHLPPVAGFVKLILRMTAWYAVEVGFSSARVAEIETAVGEAFANAVEYGAPPGQRIRVTIATQEERLSVSIEDRGDALLDLQGVPERDSIGLRREEGRNPVGSRGWGLFFIKAFADSSRSLSGPEGHTLQMEFGPACRKK